MIRRRTLSQRLWDKHVLLSRSRTYEQRRGKLSAGAKRALWRRWHRERAITAEMQTVESIARKERSKFAKHIDVQDLIGAGYVGLMQAAERYNPASGKNFSAFAWFRIRGAIIDSQKRRSYREEQNDSIERIAEMYDGWLPADLDRDRGALPDDLAARAQIAERMAAAIESLGPRDQKILRARLAGEPRAKTAKALGIRMSRVEELWGEIQWRVGVIVRGE